MLSSGRPRSQLWWHALPAVQAVKAGRTAVIDDALASEQYLPCSTFEIPNTPIGLATGVILAEKFALDRDGTRHDIAARNRNHDLVSALPNAISWVHQEVARRIGIERMRKYVGKSRCGNCHICCAVDEFLLQAELRITPERQV